MTQMTMPNLQKESILRQRLY